MISISTKDELSLYNLEGKWNDYIGAQKEIIGVLKSEGYFKDNDIVNIETGMVIRVTTRGIKETIGNGNRFQHLPKQVKKQKAATLRVLPILLRDGNLLEDNVENYYSEKGDQFAYFVSKVILDGEIFNVRMAVRKKISSNHFYIHHIDTEKSSELLSPSQETVDYEIQNS